MIVARVERVDGGQDAFKPIKSSPETGRGTARRVVEGSRALALLAPLRQPTVATSPFRGGVGEFGWHLIH